MVHIFYNPLSDNQKGKLRAEKISKNFPTHTLNFEDITSVDDIYERIISVDEKDTVIISGGDGTLSKFVNSIGERKIERPVYFYPSGSGNDFFHDVRDNAENGMVRLNEYIENLPIVTINGKEYRFLNGVGYGLDGYCCERCNQLSQKNPQKKKNYTLIALDALLFKYKPTNAKITVDGVVHNYTNVIMAPTMNGRYFGGGMKIAPHRDRLRCTEDVSVIVAHSLNKFRIITLFPTIFKGKHVKYKKYIDVLTGKNITIEYDRPAPLQIDGETMQSVDICHISVAKIGASIK